MISYIKTLLTVAIAGIMLMSCDKPLPPQVDTLWKKEFTAAQQIIDTYDSIRTAIGDDNHGLHTKNMCHYVWNSGEYMFRCRGKNEDIYQLAQYFEELDLSDDSLKSFINCHNPERFADHYFTLKAMKRGDKFDDARDGLTITVFYPIRGLNHNDYNKLKEVFRSNNEVLHKVYLEKLRFPLGNSGCNEEMYSVQPIIKENVADSKLKEEILGLFERYSVLMPGRVAPTPDLKDVNGNTRTFAEFRGKVLVIDVWATWCSSCLAGMPKYMALRDKYKGNGNIEFITVSIDRSNVKKLWKSTIAKKGMEGMINLFPDCAEQSQFESDYHISGVPRYIVIDKNGNIVSAFAPPTGKGLEELITNTLK